MCIITTKAKLASEITSLPKSTLLFNHKSISCYVIQNVEKDFPTIAAELQSKSVAAFKHQGYSIYTEPHKKISPYTYHIVAFETSAKELIASYKATLVDQTVKKFSWDYLSVSNFFTNLDTILNPQRITVLLENAFVAIDYQKKGLALILILRGLNAFLKEHVISCQLLGMTSLPYKSYSALAINLYIACMRNSISYSQNNHSIMPMFPCNEEKHLAVMDPALINLCKKTRNFDEIEQFIQNISGEPFRIPTLVRNYIKHFSAETLEFVYDHQASSLDALQIAPYSAQTSFKILA